MSIIRGVNSSFKKAKMNLSKKPEHRLDYYLYTGKDATASYFWHDSDKFDNDKKIEFLKKRARKLYRLGKLSTLLDECDKTVKDEIIADIMNTFNIDSITDFWDSIKDVSGEKFREGLENIKSESKKIELCKKYIMESRSAADVKAVIDWAQENLSYSDCISMWYSLENKKECGEFFKKLSKQALEKNDMQSLAQMWCKSPSEIQCEKDNKKLFNILLESSDYVNIFGAMDSMHDPANEYHGMSRKDVYKLELWNHTCSDLQKTNFKSFFESIKDKDAVVSAWKKTKAEIKTQDNRELLLDTFQNEPNMVIGLISSERAWIEGRTKDITKGILSREENTKKLAKLFRCQKEEVSSSVDAMMQVAQIDHKLLSLDTRLFNKDVLKVLGDAPSKQVNQLRILNENPSTAEKLAKFVSSRNCDVKMEVLGKMLEKYPGDEHKQEWLTLTDRAIETISRSRKLMKDIKAKGISKVPMDKLEALLSSGMDIKIDSINDLNNIDKLLKDKCDKDISSISLRKRRNAVLYKTFGVSIDDADAMLAPYRRGEKELSQEALDSISDVRVKSYVQCLDAIMKLKDKDTLEALYKGNVGVIHKAPKKMLAKVRESFEEALPEIVKKDIEAGLNNRYSSLAKETIDMEDGSKLSVRKMEKGLRVLIADSKELENDEDKNGVFVNGQNLGKIDTTRKVYVAYAKDAMDGDSIDVSNSNMPVAKVKKEERPKYVVVFSADKETLKSAKEVAEANKRKDGKPLEIVLVDKEKCMEKSDRTNYRASKLDLEQNARSVRNADITRVMRTFVRQDTRRDDLDRDE